MGATADKTLEWFELSLHHNVAAWASHPDAGYDVLYKSVASNLTGTVRSIYERFNLQWKEEQELALKQFVEGNPKDKHGRHQLSATDFGLTEAAMAERLRFYTERFALRE